MTPQILMIEDDERLAKMVGDYLRQSGFGFAHAADGAHGLSAVQLTPPDLVILDLMLPDMDGLEVCRRIRALPGALAQTPVLMLTAKGQEFDRQKGQEAGADKYMTKPFDPDALLEKAREGNPPGQWQGDQQRGVEQARRVVADHLLHHEGRVGAQHDHFAMRHVDDAHDAKRDGEADGGEQQHRAK